MTAAAAAVPAPPSPSGLVVDPAVPLGALRPLCEDLAARLGTLTIAVADVGAANGCARRRTQGDAVVLLSPEPARPVAEVLAHELGHVLDPSELFEQPEAESERFAETLGQLLLTHLPATVVVAAPLVAAALANRPPLAPGEGLSARLDEADAVAWWRRTLVT